MRVVVLNLTAGGISGGYKAYLKNVLPRLARLPDVETVHCYSPKTFSIEQWVPHAPNIVFRSCEPVSFRSLLHRHDRVLAYSLRQLNPDIIFIPVARYVYFPQVPIVNMVQNMGPLVPHVEHNPWSEKIRYAIQRYEVRFSVQRSNHIIAPSNFVRNFLIQHWKISPDRVTTIHYGFSETIQRVTVRPPAIPVVWTGRFIFTAGSIEPYRGLEDIIDALPSVLSKHQIEGLVIAGYTRGNMVSYHQSLRKRIERQGNSHRVVWTGMLPPEQMSWCYQNTHVFVMTSRIESFAMIGLEAMAHGCACVIADNPPLPEIFASAAHYYHSSCIADLAVQLKGVLGLSSVRRLALQQAAQCRAMEFSWDKNVETLVSVFRKSIVDHSMG